MPLDPLLTESAVSLARRIQSGELTSQIVVEAHLERALAVNPNVNAIVHDRYTAARTDAMAADVFLREHGPDRVGPFFGVPITVKECLGLAGMRQTAGLLSRRHTVAKTDATAVARLRKAGAIPIGVTNVSELMMWMESSNKVYGRTNNAYDPARTAGGSSGGEGAIIGAGASPLGLGSDIGGSIRMPAFFDGVFGHKPSTGLVPNTGHWPMSENAALRYLTTGPLCRRAEDLWPTLRLIAGPDGIDPVCEQALVEGLADPATVDLSALTVYDVTDGGLFRIDAELVAAQRRAVSHLASLGAKVVPYEQPLLHHAVQIWTAMLTATADTSFATLLGGGEPIAFASAFWALMRGRSPHTLPALGLAFAERLVDFVPGRRHAIRLGEQLKIEIDDLLRDGSILVYPSYPELAPKHGHALLPPLKWHYAAIWNVLEVPVTQIPLGLAKAGLPLGLQVVAGHGHDHLGIAVALELERAFGGWVPPPALDDLV